MTVLIPVIFLFFFVFVTYRDRLREAVEYGTWRKSLRIPIVILVIVVAPMIIMNVFFETRHFSSDKEKMEFAERYKNEELYHEAFLAYASENSNKPRIQIEYLDFYFHNYLKRFSCNVAADMYSNKHNKASIIAKAYAEYRCGRSAINLNEINRLPDTLVGVDFLKGLHYNKIGDWKKALFYFENEIIKAPDFSSPYREIVKVLNQNDIQMLDQFMLNSTFLDKVPYYQKNDYYFMKGHLLSYFKNIYINRTFNTSWIIFIAAFIVSFAWLYYMRLMDFYNREKWLHILLVFFLGGLFANFCLPFYDYARIVLNFRINGEAFNDFLYSTLVIGGAEELVKFLPWFLFGYLSGRLKEPFDYILYASVSALGFAFVENFTYFENYGNITVRAMVTSVAHMFDAAIVAYAFVIVRYRLPKDSPYKALVIILGFLLAMLAHGFYDFWLISSSVSDFRLMTMVFFVISLHIWFFFKNNAMNHSPYFKGNHEFNVQLQKDVLFLSLISVLMLQYTMMSYDFGARNLYYFFIKEVFFVGVFLVYMSIQLNKFKLAKGVWHRLSLSQIIPMESFKNFYNKISESGYSIMDEYAYGDGYSQNQHKKNNLRGLELRLFAPKSNKYIGNKLPVSGYCSKPIMVNGNSNWYLFTLNSPIKYSDFITDKIIIKNKRESESLLMDKIEIYFMFIPNTSVISKSNIRLQDLRYAGRAYSRPLNKDQFI